MLKSTLAFFLLAALWAIVAPAAENTIPEVGGEAPDFSLPVVGEKKMVQLSKLTADGPVVLVVLRGYPGYQCPICSRQVAGLVRKADSLSQSAEQVVLVYPGPASQLEKRAIEFLGDTKLPRPIVLVHDPDMRMVADWGLRWDAPRETAYPSTFVIGGDGKIAWRKVSQSHGDRASVEDLLAALKETEATR